MKKRVQIDPSDSSLEVTCFMCYNRYVEIDVWSDLILQIQNKLINQTRIHVMHHIFYSIKEKYYV